MIRNIEGDKITKMGIIDGKDFSQGLDIGKIIGSLTTPSVDTKHRNGGITTIMSRRDGQNLKKREENPPRKKGISHVRLVNVVIMKLRIVFTIRKKTKKAGDE